ncbi:hypothetical protein BX666DRAFT_1942434 [Dichotomocladium elegans]|nr:hypothetical protein BX666DRAFT_1942434 [Dichotomocladium elegans]
MSAMRACLLEMDPDASSRWCCMMAAELCLRQNHIEHAHSWLCRSRDANQWLVDEDWNGWRRIIQEKIARSKIRSGYTIASAEKYHHVDFVETLPYDLTTVIFEQLELGERVLCTRVSKRWCAFITGNTTLWQDMVFGGTSIPVEPPTFRAYLDRLHGKPLKRLKLHHERADGEALIKLLVSSRCFQLHTLDFQDLWCEKHTFFDLLKCAGPTLRVLRWNGMLLRLGDILTRIADFCPRLVELDVSYCLSSSITTSDIAGPLESYASSLPENIVKDALQLPSLPIRVLRFSGIYEMTAAHLAFILPRVPNLIQLCLEHCIVSFVPVANIIRHCCPLLERITYHRHRHAKQPIVPLKTSSIPMVARTWRQIRLSNAVVVSDTIFQDMIARCDLHKLDMLDLSGNAHLTDQALISLTRSAVSFPHLSHLSLADCTGITEKGLLKLLAVSPNLENINLAGVTTVTDYVLDMMPVRTLYTIDLRRCCCMTASGVMGFVDRRQATLKRLYLSQDLVSPETLGYVMRKIKYNDV